MKVRHKAAVPQNTGARETWFYVMIHGLLSCLPAAANQHHHTLTARHKVAVPSTRVSDSESEQKIEFDQSKRRKLLTWPQPATGSLGGLGPHTGPQKSAQGCGRSSQGVGRLGS